MTTCGYVMSHIISLSARTMPERALKHPLFLCILFIEPVAYELHS